MTIQVFRPEIQVLLYKMVARRAGRAERYAGSARVIDLTPYLGEQSAVKTVKSLYEAAGGFSITFAEKPFPGTLDTIEAMIEPMDMIEIRAAREPHRHSGQRLPLLMRGWVSEVGRPGGVGQDGTPLRSVVVSGQDSGKLWLIHSIFFEVAYLQEVPFLDLFRMQAATGMQVAMLPVSEFITQLTTRIMNPRIEGMAAFADQIIRPFRVEATVGQGIASATTAANVQGTIWNIAELFADRPWNELFIEDEEDGPIVRFRPCPYRGTNGSYIMRDANDPGTVEMDSVAIGSVNMKRSDAQVANFFWVPPGSAMLESGVLVSVRSLQSGDPLDNGYGNNDPILYGRRRMQAETRLLPNDVGTIPTMMPDATARQAGGSGITFWHQARAADLKEMNRDNVVFEDGSAWVRGSEALKVGRYLRVTEGDLTWEAYMTRVVHTIQPYRAWRTDLGLERGTGFLERTKRSSTTYFSENSTGTYR